MFGIMGQTRQGAMLLFTLVLLVCLIISVYIVMRNKEKSFKKLIKAIALSSIPFLLVFFISQVLFFFFLILSPIIVFLELIFILKYIYDMSFKQSILRSLLIIGIYVFLLPFIGFILLIIMNL